STSRLHDRSLSVRIDHLKSIEPRAVPKTQCTIRQGNQCLISALVELLRHPAAREDDRVHRPDSPLIEPSSERTAMIKAGSKPLGRPVISQRSEEHTSELQSRFDL